eukprot:GHVU01021932.1.p1 GENE.GHVU01021932.1~~GHVU01021932.1.p1  ORF type:complete len:184 (+),score=28.88 GHVU01021932.1:123-674(+)
MWSCRVCSTSPFAALFGFPSKSHSKSDLRGSSKQSAVEEAASDATPSVWEPPDAAERAQKVDSLMEYVHPRAKGFWDNDPEGLRNIITELARNVDRNDNLLAEDETKRCVTWRGALSPDGYAMMPMTKPHGEEPTETYVNRTLVFLYADEDSFQELRKHARNLPFPMICDNKKCVTLTHIVLD